MTGTIIFRNAFLIDGNGDEPTPDATLVVSDGTIREVIPDDKGTKIPKGRVIDLNGKALMPRLIDAHVHAGNIELTLRETSALPPAVYVHRATINLETDINLAFTTLRDAAGLDPGFPAAIEQDLIRRPHLLLSISPLTQTRSEAPTPRNCLGISPEICDGPEEVHRAVRRVLERGADQIKVFADGEVVSQLESDTAKPGQGKFTAEETRAAVETAEAAGTYVMAHTYCPRAIQNCLAARVRSIEHGNLTDAKTAKMMAQEDAYYVPTLATYDVLAREA